MYNSDLYRRIATEIDKIKIVDTHEHLPPPHEFAESDKIDFGWLFCHYASCDLISAGLPVSDMNEIRDANSKWTPQEKWRAMKPYYERAHNTSYCLSLRIAIQDLFGIDEFSENTVDEISRKMNDVPRDSWTRQVFNKAGIDIALNDRAGARPVFPAKPYPDQFLFDMGDRFSMWGIADLESDCGCDISVLEDYLKVIDLYFDKYAGEAAALKLTRAYDRTLFFDEVPFSEAARIFQSWVLGPDHVTKVQLKAMEDFIIHYLVGKAGEHDLPVKFHTGLQEGNGNVITNSRAALLVNLFLKYPKTKFDIFHLSWPYTDELISISKNFPNVFIDFCWMWIVNTPGARRYLSDMLETVPLNKIHGFGGDYLFVEGSYGHSKIARREIARVLTEKVEEGRFSEDYAVNAARALLRDNAMENFAISRKRELCYKRVSQP